MDQANFERLDEAGAFQERRTPRRASSYGDDHTRFLWYPYIPLEEYTVLMAPGGTGKSILTCGIAAAVTRGECLPGDNTSYEGARVLIISGEDTGEMMKKRLSLSGADLDHVFLLDCNSSMGLNFSEGYDEFEAVVKEVRPQLVIVDPWHAFLGVTVDINRVNVLRPALQKLTHLAKEAHCAMVLISHVNKRAQGENANNAATGSTDFINAARSALRVITDDGDEDVRIMVHTKSNFAAYGQSVRFRIVGGGLCWDGFSDVTRETLECAARRKSTVSEVMRGKEDRTAMNAALIAALEASASPFAVKRFSYDQFKREHGEFIFGGLQPKKAIDEVRDRLTQDGYYIRAGIGVKTGRSTCKGFMIQRIDTTDMEQVQLEAVDRTC